MRTISRTPPTRLMLQFNVERVVDAVGEVRRCHRDRQLHQFTVREVLLQLTVERLVDLDLGRELFGVADDQPFQVAIRGVGVILRKAIDLRLREADPLTEGCVVR